MPPQQDTHLQLRQSITSVDKLPTGSEKTFDVKQDSTLAVLPNERTPRQSLLPHVFRLPSIVFAFLFSLLWAVTLAMLCWLTAFWNNFERPVSEFPKIGVPIVEAVFIAGHIGVMVAFAIVCVKERKVLVKKREGKQLEA